MSEVKIDLRGGGGLLEADSSKSESKFELNTWIWLVSDDIHYFQNPSEVLKLADKNYPIHLLPKDEDVLGLINNHPSGLIILSSNYPPKNLRSLFIIKELPNKFGFLTTQQKANDVPEAQALEEKLGLSVIKSPFTLASVGGADALKKYTQQLLNAEKEGFKAKGVFLVGIPGTGKTFFPKCFAGETGRLLIQLNLSMMLETDEPIRTLNKVFEFLSKRKEMYPDDKYVILIDEIEKMIGNASSAEKRMLGRLLTVLNDINTEASEYDFNAIFFATANDLGTILENNPEFLRRGRWDELFFINLPTNEYAIDIFNIYIKKFKLESIFEQIIPLKIIMAEIEAKYSQYNNISQRFPYTAAEIENLCKRIDFICKANKKSIENFESALKNGKNTDEEKKNFEFLKQEFLECVEMIIPVCKTAQKGISMMAGQKELFIEI